MNVKLQLVTLIYMTLRLHRFTVEVINGVLVERVGMVALQNMFQPGWMSEAENPIANRVRICVYKRGDGNTYEGVNFGAQTIAMASGIIIWYPE